MAPEKILGLLIICIILIVVVGMFFIMSSDQTRTIVNLNQSLPNPKSFTHLTPTVQYSPTTFVVINESQYSEHEINLAATAVEQQTATHFGPQWGKQAIFISPSDKWKNSNKLTIPPDYVPIFIVSTGDADRQLVAYQGEGPISDNGIPNGYITSSAYIVIYQQNTGNLLSMVLSRQVLRMLANPYDNFRYVRKNILYPLDVCAPVEKSSLPAYSLMIEDQSVSVANFVYPAWFNNNSEPGKYDHLGACETSLQVLGQTLSSKRGLTLDVADYWINKKL